MIQSRISGLGGGPNPRCRFKQRARASRHGADAPEIVGGLIGRVRDLRYRVHAQLFLESWPGRRYARLSVLLRLEDVKLVAARIDRVGQGDGEIIHTSRGDGIGAKRRPLVQRQSGICAAEQTEVPAEAAGGVDLQVGLR